MTFPASIPAAIALAIPASYALAAVLARRDAAELGWRIASAAAALAGALAAVVLGLACWRGDAIAASTASPWLPGIGALAGVRLDVLTLAMLALVTFIGGVILRFSRAYLAGDAAQARYVRWLMATLAAVTLLVMTNNLLTLALAWTVTSLSLHRLLVLYPERAAAQLAARKKFLVSRAADLALLCAIALLQLHTGTFDLDAVLRAASTQPLPPELGAAAVLLVIGAALKCAQLPFHGWLIQVMEAPTPVSALLHAGVINIGGFLLIRLAPLIAAAPAARTLLVVWGTATVAIASLVMTTRVSVKVALAWSTCAQMGFMLLECGLGAYSIALLHLLGHSLYKAHAFLRSGSTVEQWQLRAQALPFSSGAGRWTAGIAMGIAAGVAALVAVAASLRAAPPIEATSAVMGAMFGFTLGALAAAALHGLGWHSARALLVAAVLAAIYVGWHAAFAPVFDATHVPPSTLQWLVASIGLAATCLVYAALKCRPRSRFAHWLQPLLFAGLYLDEGFTRFTLWLWPLRRSALAACADHPMSHARTPARTAEVTP